MTVAQLLRRWSDACITEAEARENLVSAMRRAFPIGARVWWEHGRHVRSGTVDLHGHGPVLRVYTDNFTQYWVDAARITGITEGCEVREVPR